MADTFSSMSSGPNAASLRAGAVGSDRRGGKSAFWTLARRLTHQRARLAAAMVFAAVSAGGLGAGLMGMAPIIDSILHGSSLREMAPGWAEQLRASTGITIPGAWIEGLPDRPYPSVLLAVGALAGLTVVGATANYLHALFSLTIVARAVADIRRDAFARAVRLPLAQVTLMGPADAVARVVNDSSHLATGFGALLSRGVAQATKGLAALAVAIVLDWRTTFVALPVAALLGVLLRKLGKRIRRAARSALENVAGLYRVAGESLAALRVVKTCGAEESRAESFALANEQVVRQELRARTARAASSPLVETLAVFILGALAVIATKAILDGALSVRDFVLVLGALGVAASSIKPITSILADIQQASGAASRIQHLLGLPEEAGLDPALPELPRAAHGNENGARVRLEDVSFTYPGAAAPALERVSVDIAAGRTVALVGPNGSGKTTLMSLIPRLIEPDAGRVLIDETDIAGVRVTSVRARLGVVPQEPVLFRATIRENIALGMAGATDEQVRDAARRALAEPFILERPGGYDAPIGEGGTGLSGGQKQRLAIARAILRDPSVLLLDEATSMIDAESEAAINLALSRFSRGRTCIIVAHRLSTVLAADRIVVLDAGRVVDEGTHAELMERCRVYRSLAQTQLQGGPPPTPSPSPTEPGVAPASSS